MGGASGRDKLRRGRRKAAEDKNDSVNSEEVTRKLEPQTKKGYEGAIENWDSFVSDWREDGETATLDNFERSKRYVEELAMGTEGRLGTAEPSVNTILKEWKFLTAAKRWKKQPVKSKVITSTRNVSEARSSVWIVHPAGKRLMIL